MATSFVRYGAGLSTTVWSEEDLARVLGNAQGVPRGNRVILLYGAAGSGKSETLRWLQAKMDREYPERGKALIRIPRTALDPVRIADTILKHYGLNGLDAQLDRWESLKQKPVALANQVIWGALGDLLTRDHDIIPLSYKLRPVVEANLRAGIEGMKAQGSAAPFELLTREQLRGALQASAVACGLPYEALLARMREEFDQAVLGDLRLAPTLRMLSQLALDTWGVRPILLIDDLVQSLNVYASDLLDYFLTLEEGDWDVVVGLTPASFEGTERTRELLQRINQLDTIDDRVTRLYLSDVRGDDSSFLTEDSVEQFLETYLLEIKRSNGFACDEGCPGFSTCQELQTGQVKHTRLSPFNPALLRRMFRRLPRGKGKPRYLLTTVRGLLEAANQGVGTWLAEIRDHIQRDAYAEIGDARLKTFAEAYAPDLAGSSTVLQLSERVTALAAECKEPHTITVHPLSGIAESETEEYSSSVPTASSVIDSDSAAVRDWLEGLPVNKELLKPLRTGVARWVKDMSDPTRLSGFESLRPAGVLRWSVQADDTDLPLRLEGVDDEDGVTVPRQLGLVAFDLIRYGRAVGRGKEGLVEKFLDNPETYGLVMEAERWQREKITQLEQQLGMSLDQFAHNLAVVLFAVPGDMEPGSAQHALPSLPKEGIGFIANVAFGRRERHLAMSLWQDAFRVRDNVYRATSLQELGKSSLDQALKMLVSIDPARIEYGYKLGSGRLREYLETLTSRLNLLRQLNSHPGVQALFHRFLSTCNVQAQVTSVEARTRLRRSINSFHKLLEQLPLPLRQQLPDLTLPHMTAVGIPEHLIEGARLAMEHPKEVPPLATYLLASQVSVELGNPWSSAILDWTEKISTCTRIISAWGGEEVKVSGEAESVEGDVLEKLERLVDALRLHLVQNARPEPNAWRGDCQRWNRRLQTLEAILPKRSALRKRFENDLRALKSKPCEDLNWAQLESTIRRVVQSWRSIHLVTHVIAGPIAEFEGLLEFIHVVSRGEETESDLERWESRLKQALRRLQVSKGCALEYGSILMALARGEDQLILSQIPASTLQELRLYLPHVFRRLRLTVG